jgi:hypothetical protein
MGGASSKVSRFESRKRGDQRHNTMELSQRGTGQGGYYYKKRKTMAPSINLPH